MKAVTLGIEPFECLKVLDFQMKVTVNDHGTAVFTGFIPPEKQETYLRMMLEDTWCPVSAIEEGGEGFSLLPERVLLYVESSQETFFSYVISFPCFLISEGVQEVLELYEPGRKRMEVILVDGIYGTAKLYYLPQLPELDCLSERTVYGSSRLHIEEIVLELGKIGDSSLFRVKGTDLILIRLDLAESILRRGARGISLKEVRTEAGMREDQLEKRVER